MHNILNALFNGDIIPWDRQPCNLADQQELSDKIDVEERYFLGILSPDDCVRFESLSQLHGLLSTASEADAFSYGVSLGLLTALDVTRYAKKMSPQQ